MPAPRAPIATYRLQFHKGFGLRDATELLDYFHRLGVRDIYASPLLKARAGSAHGYDVTDPGRINPEIGSPEDFDVFAMGLRARGMGLVLDIVPNHMAASLENPWWADVIEAGVDSPHARMFDIDWRPDRPGARDRLFLPILGKPFGEALEARELRLVFGPGGFKLRYMNHELPIHPATYRLLFPELLRPEASVGSDEVGEVGGGEEETCGGADMGEDGRRLADLLRFARPADPMGYAARAFAKRKLWEAAADDPRIARRIEAALERVNGAEGRPESLNELEDLLEAQNYLLAFWGAAGEDLNYRRFFNINELVGLRADDPAVFEQTHELVLRLAREGKITGLRIDHIDGLRDPAGYLARLRDALASPPEHGRARPRDFHIIVEKILAEGEALPADWPIQGATGYDFLNHLNNLFVDESGFDKLDETARRFTGEEGSFREEAVAVKRRVMLDLFPRELHALTRTALLAADMDRRGRDLTRGEIFDALVEISARLPVYRTYIRGGAAGPRDRGLIRAAAEECARAGPTPGARALDFLERALTGRVGRGRAPSPALELIARWQQFTGPAMAKGLEDTAHYVFVRFIAMNEVGGDPGARPGGLAAFHARNAARAARSPRALNASSTHDTKRGEDVRARINVLSEMPEAWDAALARWSAMTEPFRRLVGGAPAPGPSEEIFIYQTLIGAWPLDAAEEPAFRERLRAYLVKAMREAKRRTDWLKPDMAYEGAVLDFADAITDPERGAAFLADFREFVEPIMMRGALNSLSAILIKIASPGVPDFYQGTEMWDFSLVDPDNRRPVDYGARAAALESAEALEASQLSEPLEPAGLRALMENWRDGRIKLFMIKRALAARVAAPELFSEGTYEPLFARGENAERVCAFMRRRGAEAAVAIAPRLTLGLGAWPGNGGAKGGLGTGGAWGGARIKLPSDAAGAWRDAITGRAIRAGETLDVDEALSEFPLALLVRGGAD